MTARACIFTKDPLSLLVFRIVNTVVRLVAAHSAQEKTSRSLFYIETVFLVIILLRVASI